MRISFTLLISLFHLTTCEILSEENEIWDKKVNISRTACPLTENSTSINPQMKNNSMENYVVQGKSRGKIALTTELLSRISKKF